MSQGKTFAVAKGDVFRGLEVVETASNIGNGLMREMQENLFCGLDTYTYRQPLAVCPFNFPAIIPPWLFPMAAGSGNMMLMKPIKKPSEKDSGAAMILSKLGLEAGLPDCDAQVGRECGVHDAVLCILIPTLVVILWGVAITAWR
jgi:malonate-semialdehyde dehydrogenase (acetylating)/methylmalonate-semialdehyde dehydrogenase